MVNQETYYQSTPNMNKAKYWMARISDLLIFGMSSIEAGAHWITEPLFRNVEE